MLIGLMIIVLYVQNIHGELILPFVKDSHSCLFENDSEEIAAVNEEDS